MSINLQLITRETERNIALEAFREGWSLRRLRYYLRGALGLHGDDYTLAFSNISTSIEELREGNF